MLAALLVALASAFDLSLYLLPHVLPVWSPTNQTANVPLFQALRSVEQILFMLRHVHITTLAPDLYLPLPVNDNLVSFEQATGDTSLLVFSANPSAKSARETMLRLLRSSNSTRALGLLFQQVSDGSCLGDASRLDLLEFRSLDDELSTHATYRGMHALDARVLQNFHARHPLFSTNDYPQLRSIFFNGIDLSAETAAWIVSLSTAFNATAVLDVSDLGTPAFGYCSSLCEALQHICTRTRVAFVINRSGWLLRNAVLNYLIENQSCFDTVLPTCLAATPDCLVDLFA